MATPYRWRKLEPEDREKLLLWRKRQEQPWHRPPHREGYAAACYHITAACYEHVPHIGKSAERISEFSEHLLTVFANCRASVHAWCVLPNHYHVLAQTAELTVLLEALGKMNGRTSHRWNGEDDARGRKVWCGVVERTMRSDQHFWATLNYVHHNPVRHRYVEKWQDWPFSSAHDYLEAVGAEQAALVWKKYPVLNYGDGWDDPHF